MSNLDHVFLGVAMALIVRGLLALAYWCGAEDCAEFIGIRIEHLDRLTKEAEELAKEKEAPKS